MRTLPKVKNRLVTLYSFLGSNCRQYYYEQNLGTKTSNMDTGLCLCIICVDLSLSYVRLHHFSLGLGKETKFLF